MTEKSTKKSDQCLVHVNCFVYNEGVVLHDYALTINKEFYIKVLKILHDAMKRKQPRFRGVAIIRLHNDKVPVCSATSFC